MTYTIKRSPEDFIVEEVAHHKPGEQGLYALCLLEKREVNTLEAIRLVARSLRLPLKHVGFAGSKDRNALTKQYITLKGISRPRVEGLSFDRVSLTYLGRVSASINLGHLDGNRFTITVRDLTPEQKALLESKQGDQEMLNLFGEQRFSTANVAIGRAILQRDFKRAIDLIAENNIASEAHDHIRSHPSDPIGALRKVSPRLLRLFIAAYQSALFNRLLKKFPEEEKLPLVGFGTRLEGEVGVAIEEELRSDHLAVRSFVLRELPGMTQEGQLRRTHVTIADMRIVEAAEDHATITFVLPKGAYATMALAFLLEELDGRLGDLGDGVDRID